MLNQSAKTIGQALMEQVRVSAGAVSLSGKYWGSALEYSRGRYFVNDYKTMFGGMKCYSSRRIPARLISICATTRQLEVLLQPVCDFSPGDTINYTSSNVQPGALELAITSIS